MPPLPVVCKPSFFQLVNKMLKAAARRAGIGEITHTMLRRTAIHAVEKLEPGRGWLFAGHASDATTRTWYLPAEIEYHSLPMPQLVR